MADPSGLELLQDKVLPVAPQAVKLEPDCGLVIVDIVKGFAEVGRGALAPPVPNPQVSRMIGETDALAKRFVADERPILAFLDTHAPGKPEPPYPPHCEMGSGEEELVDELAWLTTEKNVTPVRKDCINGFIGAINPDGGNTFVDWVHQHQLRQIITVGICTDICVMDFVLTTLSARNHGLLGNLAEVIVFEPGCATYDLSAASAIALGAPRTAIHPQSITHHAGLYFMAARGAVIAASLS
jgi:nicotinamidase-related amidase